MKRTIGSRPFSDDLFKGAPGPAVGANHDVFGYRLRDVNELHAVEGAKDRDVANFDTLGHALHSEYAGDTHEDIRSAR